MARSLAAAARLGRELGNTSRLVLAVKTAAAAAIAWYLAPFVPFAESEYSYYAPLGVLVSMYTTVVDSVRSGLQALFGLSVGIGLGLGALAIVIQGVPAIVAVALVVAVGVALGGLHVFGAGREWIPIAGVFVLLLGGRDARDFSLSYLVTMGFGVIVGLLVQWIAAPPLYLSEARARLSDLRRALSSCLDATAAAVDEQNGEDRERAESLRRAVDDLLVTVRSVSEEIQEARKSERVNPRARRRRAEGEDMDEQYRSLDRAAFFVRALADLIPQRGIGPERVDGAVEDRLAEAIRRCGSLASASGDPEAREDEARRAREALDEYVRALDEDSRPGRSAFATETAAGSYLRRIIDVLS